jgi:hypothetical protein
MAAMSVRVVRVERRDPDHTPSSLRRTVGGTKNHS